ncbi:protein kinase [Oleoguttula sp. CCFEE 5521]
MAGNGDLIDFEVIESHKENIQALPGGRSAKALAQIYSPPLLGPHASPALVQDANSKERIVFERELASIDEADDPLDVYDRYVKWTLNAYPSAQATPNSGLLSLLERATKAFQASPVYKNDPRYLKIWLHYIRFFSDASREAFVFLSRQGIGEALALYYEEYAAWLEHAGRWVQAEEIYKMGIEKEARPAERLMRKFGEFERRKDARPADADEPSSPALPTVRPALMAKLDPFAAPAASTQQQPAASTSRKPKSSKMQIFSDDSEPARPDSGASSKGWDNIGSLAERKRENTHAAKPWAGETLKTGKTNGGMPKMAVFKDTCVRNPKNGRLECVFVNLEAVYPGTKSRPEEYCFEELRARRRGWLGKQWEREPRKRHIEPDNDTPMPEESRATMNDAVERSSCSHVHPAESAADVEPLTRSKQRGFEIFADEKPEGIVYPEPDHAKTASKRRGFQIFEDTPLAFTPAPPPESPEKVLVETFSRTMTLNDENDENASPLDDAKPSQAEIAKRIRREERANRTRNIKVMGVKHIKNETKTIQINLNSPTGAAKVKRKKSVDKPTEPTMTINTKEAMDEVYDLFNAPLGAGEANDPTDVDEGDSEDDYTTGDESTRTGQLSAPISEYGDETRNEIFGAQEDVQKPEEGTTNGSGWSGYTGEKHAVSALDESVDTETHDTSTIAEEVDVLLSEEIVTPQEENFQTHRVPIPDEDNEPPSTQYRQQATMLPNHRLPFMTPIAEQTESSLGMGTSRSRDYFSHSKTPSRPKSGTNQLFEDDEAPSSPFDEVTTDLAEVKYKVLQPVRTKTTKGTVSLGQGSAKSQIAAKSAPKTPVEIFRGPVIQELQCNPMDLALRASILSQLKPSLNLSEGYQEYAASSNRTTEIKRYIKYLAKTSRSSTAADKTGTTICLPPSLTFPSAKTTYTIKRELGAGTFAPVYLVENSTAIETATSGTLALGKQVHRKPLEALKMESPTSAWEFHILHLAHARLGLTRAAESIIRAHEMHLYRDECFLIIDYRSQGTLLDLVNLARADPSLSTSGSMDEVLVMFLTVELFRTVEALHGKGIIHGDLKGDNVLVRFDDPGQETDWSPTYFPSGAHGWASKGVSLIDFGRGVDMRQFRDGVGFIADWKTSEADCAEMREMRPWTYQIDYHGLAGIVHSMLFGKYMETFSEKGTGLGHAGTKTYRIKENLKRYWQVEIWGEVFAMLLNPLAHVGGEGGGKMPMLRGMRGLRTRMEEWLEGNCEKGVGLKGMIERMEMGIWERRRKSVKR